MIDKSIVETSKGNPHTTFTEDSLIYLLKRNFRFTKQLNYTINEKNTAFKAFFMETKVINIEDLENLMKHYKIANRKKDFIYYGWLMFLSDFEEKNCKLNLKDGLLPIAESYIKYEQYESASKVSHSAYFARSLSYKESTKFVLNLLYYSFANVTNAMKYYFERYIKKL